MNNPRGCAKVGTSKFKNFFPTNRTFSRLIERYFQYALAGCHLASGRSRWSWCGTCRRPAPSTSAAGRPERPRRRRVQAGRPRRRDPAAAHHVEVEDHHGPLAGPGQPLGNGDLAVVRGGRLRGRGRAGAIHGSARRSRRAREPERPAAGDLGARPGGLPRRRRGPSGYRARAWLPASAVPGYLPRPRLEERATAPGEPRSPASPSGSDSGAGTAPSVASTTRTTCSETRTSTPQLMSKRG